MSLYLNTITNELRELPDSYIDELIAAGNPKAAQWQPTPPKPSDNATWSNGQWIQPYTPTFTAEEWTDSQGYGGNRSTTLLYQKLRLDAAAKSSLKLNTVQGWLDGMIASGLAPASSNWSAAPYSFEETLTETLTILTPP